MKWSLPVGLVAAGLLGVSVAYGQDAKPAKPEQPPAKQPEAKQPEAKQPEVKQTENLPTAESLFEKHIAAIGGMAAVKAEKNRLVRARYVGPGETGEGLLRVMRVPPNKLYQTLEIPGKITQEVWCNGEEGWMRDTNHGTHRLGGDSLVEFKRQADYFGEMNYKARYKEVKTISAEKFNDVDAYAVKAVPNEGTERIIYFDVKSGLMIGIKTPGPAGAESDQTMMLQDYKKFGEILQPTVMVSKSRAIQSTITIIDIRTDLVTMPSVDPPDEVRAVK